MALIKTVCYCHGTPTVGCNEETMQVQCSLETVYFDIYKQMTGKQTMGRWYRLWLVQYVCFTLELDYWFLDMPQISL